MLSPSTRRTDLVLKHERYQRARIPSYWIIDPVGPTLLAVDRVDGAYVETAQLGRHDTWEATAPFPVTIRPDPLID